MQMTTRAKPAATRRDSFDYGRDDVANLGATLNGGDQPAATMVVTLVRKEVVQIPKAAGQDGLSIGGFIDAFFKDVAIEGGEVQEFNLELTEETWATVANQPEVIAKRDELRRNSSFMNG